MQLLIESYDVNNYNVICSIIKHRLTSVKRKIAKFYNEVNEQSGPIRNLTISNMMCQNSESVR